MAKLVNVATKSYEEVPDSQAAQAITDGSHAFEKGTTVNMISPKDGNTYAVPAEYASHFLSQGSRIETASDIQAAQDEAQYGDRPLAAGVAGAARGASFGLSDYLGAKLGYGDSLRKLKEQNEGASIAGEVGGVGASLLVPGPNLVKGAGLVGEGVAHAVAPVAERLIGAGAEQGLKAAAQRIAGQAIAKGAGSAVEGALYGAGQTLSESSLGNVEANGELLASNMGISALIGGAIGAAIPVAGGLLKGGSKLIPGWVQPGEDGHAATNAVNKLYAKLSTVFGGNEETFMNAANDAPGLARAFEMGEGGATEEIRSAANSLAESAKNISGEGYNLVDDKIAELASNNSDTSQALAAAKDKARAAHARSSDLTVADNATKTNLFGTDLHLSARDILLDAQKELDETPKSFSGSTRNAVELANNALDGMVPGLKTDWNALREAVLDDHPGFVFANRSGGMSEEGMGSFNFLPKNASPELQQEFSRLQVKSVIRAKQEVQEALQLGPFKSFEGTATNEKFLLDLKAKLNDVALNIPGVGDALKGANAAYSSFKQDMGTLLKSLTDRDGNVDMQKSINFIRSGGAKGEKVEDIISRAENYLDKIRSLHEGTTNPEVAAKLQSLESSFNSLKKLRDTGKTYSDLQELKRMAGPSGSGAGMIAEALAVASGHLNPGLTAGLAPATSPYYYFKGLTTLRQSLRKQINAQRLAKIERIIGGESKTVADVAANSIKALAKATRVPAILIQSQNTVQDFKDRQALLRQMQNVDPTQLYQSIHNLVGQPAPAHAVSTAKVANTAVQYLSSKLPAPGQTPAASLPFEKKDPLPSKMEMQSFNATFDAVQNPKLVLEALGNGTLKPEHVDALRTVYPNLYEQIGTAITTYCTNHPGELPYASRLRLGTWFGQPTTKELSQSYVAASQNSFAPEPSSAENEPKGNARVGKITLGSRTSTPIQIAMAGKNS